jgi:hypothetical protein
MRTRLSILSSIALCLSSCSALIDVERQQCTTDGDCVRLGAAFAGTVCEHNLCVEGSGGEAGAPSDPLVCAAIEPSSEPKVKYTFAPVFAPGAEPADAKPFTVKACDQLDIECEHPVFGPLEVTSGEPQDFEVQRGFQGFFEIKNPDTIDGLMFLGRPVNEDTAGWATTMPTPQVVTQLAFATGEDIDPELGFILSTARDCAGEPLADVSYSNSKQGLGYYFVMSLPNTELTATGPQGAAGFANVPIGTTVLSGEHVSGKKLGPVSLRVRPNTLSFAELWP